MDSDLTTRNQKCWRRYAYETASRARVRIAGSETARRGVTHALKALGGGVGYGVLVEPRWIQTTQIDVPIVDLPAELDGYRIAHLTDIHYNMILGEKFLSRVVEKANALDADVMALTGDFITHNARRLEPCMEILSGLAAPDGLLAVRGNHDAVVPWWRADEVMGRAGIELLENRHRRIRPTRHRAARLPEERPATTSGITIAGVGDIWTGMCAPGLAMHGALRDDPMVLLSHNPQVTKIIPTDARVDLILSGHTHGGQIRPMGRSISMFSGGEREHVCGLGLCRDTAVYVSRGVGSSAFHFRWNCRPEIALLVLRRATNCQPGE